MVQPAERDCVFIAHLSAKSTGLSKPNVMGLGRGAAAHDARLSPDELTVLLVAQANGFRRNATTARRHPTGYDCRPGRRIFDCGEWLSVRTRRLICRHRSALCSRYVRPVLAHRGYGSERYKPFAEARFHELRVVPSRGWLELGWRSLRVVQPK